MPPALTCLLRRSFEPNALLAAHPPRLFHDQKQLVFALACPPGARHAGTIEVTRWAAAALPAACTLAASALIARPGVFDYAGATDGVWHVNFADPRLFFAYGSRLLAQDELQCAEHPALGSVREAIAAEDEAHAWTVDRSGPTPVLVRGAERRCAIATDVNPDEDRPAGLYGNQFAYAPEAAIRRAVRALAPAVPSNLIAIAAPSGGHGVYTPAELAHVLVTAYTGFAAAVAESRRAWPGTPVEIRTGFWGCGAFGGNRVVMTMLQILAAQLAGVDRLAFYVFDAGGLADYRAGEAALASRIVDGAPLADALASLAALGLRWGVGNGT
ncbi:MAG TPA: hypothetical protein VFP84_03695 [Kofleriaceae bacterium]|nr:hypothetical protein [Kofleriaceae bacterium]